MAARRSVHFGIDEDELADLSELYDLLSVFTASEALIKVRELKEAVRFWTETANLRDQMSAQYRHNIATGDT